MTADKRQKFVDLAEKRVTRTIREMRLIGNLANKHNYTYTDKDAQAIVKALDAEVKLLKQRFDSQGTATQTTFKLDGDA